LRRDHAEALGLFRKSVAQGNADGQDGINWVLALMEKSQQKAAEQGNVNLTGATEIPLKKRGGV